MATVNIRAISAARKACSPAFSTTDSSNGISGKNNAKYCSDVKRAAIGSDFSSKGVRHETIVCGGRSVGGADRRKSYQLNVYCDFLLTLRVKKEETMSKYAVHTKWYWPNGLETAENMQGFMRDEIKPGSLAEDVLWWKLDDNHHMAVIIYPSEEAAKQERAAVEANRKKVSSDEEGGLQLLEENIGPIMAQMSEV